MMKTSKVQDLTKKKIKVARSDNKAEAPPRNSRDFFKEAEIKREPTKQTKISI